MRLSGLDPVPLSKMGTHLLASLGSKGEKRNSLACLKNAGSHSAVTYCRWQRGAFSMCGLACASDFHVSGVVSGRETDKSEQASEREGEGDRDRDRA